jgi:DNA-binding LacI/PurR family transcriptional regulator
MPPVNMGDAARRARVSISTVSKAVNHPERVSGDSLRRVQQAIEELGFVRNEAARQLRRGHSRTAGFVMLDGKNLFFMDVARGAEDRAAEFGLVLTFGDSARDINREASYLDLFEQQRVRGVLISPTATLQASSASLRIAGLPPCCSIGRVRTASLVPYRSTTSPGGGWQSSTSLGAATDGLRSSALRKPASLSTASPESGKCSS